MQELREVTAPSINEVVQPEQGSTVSTTSKSRRTRSAGTWKPMGPIPAPQPTKDDKTYLRCARCDHRGGQLVKLSSVDENGKQEYGCAGGCAHQREIAIKKLLLRRGLPAR